ncbi:MAG: hemK [Ilumatobacteraceae bacterium]|nr:hemK [Ilumatobacteraceae bacterium]
MTEHAPGDTSGDPAGDPVTWRQLLDETTTALGDRHHARWMCEVASGCDADELRDALDEPATHRMVAHLDALIARRLAGEPLQYVLGSWQFRRLDLMVDRRVLIPRPETEWVCEAALSIARTLPAPLTAVDLGTGSGAIGLSLAAELPIGSARVWLADVSTDALDVARANLAGVGRAGAPVQIVHGSWFAALPDTLRGTIDLVVANPPYIAADDPAVADDVVAWEPHLALFGGDDGLRDLREIVADAPSWLRRGGWLVMEIGADQGDAVRALLDAASMVDVEIRPDLTGRDRIAIGRRAG